MGAKEASIARSATPPEQGPMDYTSLRKEGIRHLERMAGQQWSDFNAHDPGITMLEQFCYALTDLGYRIDYDIKDLLASWEDDPYRFLYCPDEILTTDAVTLADMRRLALDVEGVRNVWVEPVVPSEKEIIDGIGYMAIGLDFEVAPGEGEQDVTFEPEQIKGLYRVLIALADPYDSKRKEIVQAVARQLHAHRNLCEDFESIEIVEPQPVTVRARIEIRPVEQPDAVLTQICKIIADSIAPPVRFATLEELIKQDLPLDEIFDGPLLERGFLTADALEAAPRREEIHTSDLIREIMSVEAVRTVQSITVNGKAWVLKLETDTAPTLDLNNSSIELTRDDMTVAGPSVPRLEQTKAAAVPLPSAIMPPRGRNRNVGRYRSILHQFPACYGVGEAGLPLSAPPQRRAAAKQLKAYLMFFDQLLANEFAQLANAGALFSLDPPEGRTCFSQLVGAPGGEEERLGLDEIRVSDAQEHATELQSITETSFRDSGQDASDDRRRNRFLDHLLARVGEQLTDYALVQGGLDDDKVIGDKQAFLGDYPRISAARGSGADCLTPFGEDNRSGLEQRIRRKLGLTDDERFCVVEHILLRPVTEDVQQDVPRQAGADGPIPYSLQISFVLPGKTGRFADPKFQTLVERTVMEETPAHLMIRIHWLGINRLEEQNYPKFETDYQQWHDARCRDLGIPVSDGAAETETTTIVRDRLVANLKLFMSKTPTDDQSGQSRALIEP